MGAKGDEGLSPEPAQWRIIFLGPGGTFENFKPSRFRGAELPEIKNFDFLQRDREEFRVIPSEARLTTERIRY